MFKFLIKAVSIIFKTVSAVAFCAALVYWACRLFKIPVRKPNYTKYMLKIKKRPLVEDFTLS